MEKRIILEDKSINIAKGIGILLMVAGHSGMPNLLTHFVYAFHMPLFFIISGYCFKEKYINEPWTFVRKRFKGLYVPYVKYMLLFILLHNVFTYMHFYEYFYTTRDFARCAFYTITTMGGWEGLLGGYWFLTQLFLCSLIGFSFLRLGSIWTYIGGSIFLVASFVASSYEMTIPNHCPITDVTFKATFFYLTGRIIAMKGIQLTIIWAVVGMLMVLCSSLYTKTGILSVSSYMWFLYSFFAVVGTLSVIAFSRFIFAHSDGLAKILNWTGRHTLEILTWHFLGFKIVSCVLVAIYGLSIDFLGEFPVIVNFSKQGWWVAYFICGTLFSVLISSAITHVLILKNKSKWV